MGAGLAGGVLVIGFSYLFGVGRYNGAGMSVIVAAVEQGQALPWDFLCKIFLTALTLACGFKGGEVVPSFFVGATFGCVVGPLLGLPPGLQRQWAGVHLLRCHQRPDSLHPAGL